MAFPIGFDESGSEGEYLVISGYHPQSGKEYVCRRSTKGFSLESHLEHRQNGSL